MTTTKPDLCCHRLRSLLADAGQRGLSAIVASDGSATHVLVQARGVAHEDKPKLAASASALPVSVSLSHSKAIDFCPFCGASLAATIASASTRFEALVVEHARFDD